MRSASGATEPFDPRDPAATAAEGSPKSGRLRPHIYIPIPSLGIAPSASVLPVTDNPLKI
jgi:hypothetical protein